MASVSLDNELVEVKAHIDKVEAQIVTIEGRQETATGDDIAYLRDKEKQLRDKEKQLRDKEKQLRDKEIILLQKQGPRQGEGTKVYARRWVGKGQLKSISLLKPHFDELYVCVREEFGLLPFKLYYLPPSAGLNFHHRIRIDSDATVGEYLLLVRPRPQLLLYMSDSSLDDSPNANPREEEESVRSAASSSSRGSAQENWATAVRKACNNKCVACGQADAKLLDAAHLIPVSGFFSDQLPNSGLVTCYDPRNGVLLCRSCHSYFDTGHWCVENERFIVSDALQHREAAWATRHEQPFPCEDASVDTTSLNWPLEALWNIRVEYFATKQAKRRAEAKAKQYVCDACGKRYASDSFHLRDHQSKCSGIRIYLFTPEKLAMIHEDGMDAGRTHDEEVGVNLLTKFENTGGRGKAPPPAGQI